MQSTDYCNPKFSYIAQSLNLNLLNKIPPNVITMFRAGFNITTSYYELRIPITFFEKVCCPYEIFHRTYCKYLMQKFSYVLCVSTFGYNIEGSFTQKKFRGVLEGVVQF